MTDQEINIAIAESVGHTYHKPTPEETDSGSYYQYEPDYCNDLNSIHEVEKTLNVDQQHIYVNLIYKLESKKEIK